MNTYRDSSKDKGKRRHVKPGSFSRLYTSAYKPVRWNWRSIAKLRRQSPKKKTVNVNKPRWRKVQRKVKLSLPGKARWEEVMQKEIEKNIRNRASSNHINHAKIKTWHLTATWKRLRVRRKDLLSMQHLPRILEGVEEAKSQWILSLCAPWRINNQAQTTTWNQP